MASSLNTPDVLTQPIAENGDKNIIPSTNDQSLGQMSQSTGFPEICSERIADGGKAPRRADFNGVFNMLSRYIFFNQNGGVETFRADVSTAIGGYPKDAILGYKTATEFKLVRSLIANNTYNFNTTPSYIDDGAHWESVIPMSKNIADWSTNVTNCITEIPQDIKLELSAGTLTLKAGSKVYVPNGPGVCDIVTIPSDKTFSYSYDANQYFLFYSPGGNIDIRDSSLVFSGSTEPALSQNTFWYDTTNNVIKKYSNGQWNPGYSFPVGLITTSTSGIVSIDQVFNGLGYIGSTLFALPGVKMLIPNGLNADGSLNNKKSTTGTVLTYTETNNITVDTNIALTDGGLSWHNFVYNPLTNKNSAPSFMPAGNVSYTNGKISLFDLKQPFRAVDYSDYNNLVNDVNTKDAQNVKVTGNQTIGGTKTFSSVAYATASDANNSILTTVAKSKTGNGYFKLGNGLIIQWGHVDDPDNQQVYMVNLPTAFTSTNYKTMVIIDHNTQSHTFYPDYINSADRTTTTFGVYRTGDGRYNPFEWIAIGY